MGVHYCFFRRMCVYVFIRPLIHTINSSFFKTSRWIIWWYIMPIWMPLGHNTTYMKAVLVVRSVFCFVFNNNYVYFSQNMENKILRYYSLAFCCNKYVLLKCACHENKRKSNYMTIYYAYLDTIKDIIQLMEAVPVAQSVFVF